VAGDAVEIVITEANPRRSWTLGEIELQTRNTNTPPQETEAAVAGAAP
jgi:hypothetical protein